MTCYTKCRDKLAAVTSVGRTLNTNMEVVTSGVVHVYVSSNNWGWKYSTALKSDTGGDGFGTGLAVGDSIVAVGAPYDSRWIQNAGAVYIYNGVSPSFVTSTIYADHTDKDAYFGSTVAIVKSLSHFKNGAVIVGAPGHNHDQHKQAGAVYIYCKQYGSVYYKLNGMLEPSELKDNGMMGYSMSAYGNTLAVGAPGANTVYLFELLQHVHECPHGHEDLSNVPQGACTDYHRALQGGGGHEGEGEQKNHEQEERERENREYQNRNVYYVWNYEEIFDIHVEDRTYENAMFGSSLAVYNSSVLSVVVGAPDMTSGTTGAGDAGAVYVFTVMEKSDIWSNYEPDGYHKEEEPHHLRKLQGGAPGGDHHEEERRHRKWDPTNTPVGWDSQDNFWLREMVVYGTEASQQLGYAVAADYSSLFIGSNSEDDFGKGSVQVYERQDTDNQDYDRPIISGPLFKRVFQLTGTLSDTYGNAGDKFGSALALYQQQALVGSYLRGITSATNVGTGAAYIFNAVTMMSTTASPTRSPTRAPVATLTTAKTSSSSSWFTKNGHIDTSSALNISLFASLVLLTVVSVAYGIYKQQGGKTEASAVLGASWAAVQEFGTSTASKLPSWCPGAGVGPGAGSSSKGKYMPAMDDSTNSVAPMGSLMDSSRGSYAPTAGSRGGPPLGPKFTPAGARGFSPQAQQQQQQQSPQSPLLQHQQYQQPPQPRHAYPVQGQQGAPRSYPSSTFPPQGSANPQARRMDDQSQIQGQGLGRPSQPPGQRPSPYSSAGRGGGSPRAGAGAGATSGL